MAKKDLTKKLTINGLTLGISVDKSHATKYHETATLPYNHGSRLNPDYSNIETGEKQIK